MSDADGARGGHGVQGVSQTQRLRRAAHEFEDSPLLTPRREEAIRDAVRGAEPFGTTTPAWMVICLLTEVDRLRGKA